MLIGNKDINFILLNKLDDKELCGMRLVNRYFNNITSDDMFWLNYIINKYNNIDIDILKKYKGNSWYKYYTEDLSRINSYNCNKYLKLGSTKGRLDHVILSLNNGANIHYDNDYAIIWASLYNHLDIVKYLLENGADIHAHYDGALRWSSREGHLDIVRYLVENKANIHTYNDEAIIWSSYYGRLEVVKYLVENGADIHADNNAPFKWAIENNHTEIVKYLTSLY